ncbi:MAG TPA: DUF1345 domain-containing protein [Allosphingosinicella sp.]|nr:DUF1345 domain-containing protein [Allosphingosinicella sp.]
MASTIGNRVAPAKFVAFMALLVLAAPAAAFAFERLSQDSWRDAAAKGFMVGFDIAALIFLAACLPLLKVTNPAVIREHGASNDANRTMLLVITAAVSVAILAAVAVETLVEGGLGLRTKALIVATLLIAWLFANSVYALHYAHLCMARNGGILFPGGEPPVYADFAYFSFTLGMTFQTSDINITDKAIRNVVTFHCLAAFVFNLGILAFTINVLGG